MAFLVGKFCGTLSHMVQKRVGRETCWNSFSIGVTGELHLLCWSILLTYSPIGQPMETRTACYSHSESTIGIFWACIHWGPEYTQSICRTTCSECSLWVYSTHWYSPKLWQGCHYGPSPDELLDWGDATWGGSLGRRAGQSQRQARYLSYLARMDLWLALDMSFCDWLLLWSLGPLAGVPVSLKDSIGVKGFDSSIGYSSKTRKPCQEDAAMVKMLRDAGMFRKQWSLVFHLDWRSKGAIPYVKTNVPITLLSFESTNEVNQSFTHLH